MRPRKIHFVVNPASDSFKTRKTWKSKLHPKIAERYGAGKLCEYEVFETERSGHACTHVRSLIKSLDDDCEHDLIVSVGGDGTHNEVVNGFFDDDGIPLRSKRKIPAVLFLTSGTGQDLARTLRIPKDISSVLDFLIGDNEVMDMDAGSVVCQGLEGGTVTRHFVNEASVGLSAATAHRVNNSPKSMSHFTKFVWSSLCVAAKHQNKPVRMIMDGVDAGTYQLFLSAIGNCQYFGSGMRPCPGAIPTDGKFQVTLLKDVSTGSMVWDYNKFVKGAIYREPSVICWAASEVRMEPVEGDQVVLECDGEVPGCLPATFTTRAKALRVLLPKGGQKEIEGHQVPIPKEMRAKQGLPTPSESGESMADPETLSTSSGTYPSPNGSTTNCSTSLDC